MKDEKKVKQGKQSRAQGAQFEIRVRKDLEEKGWNVDKWSNNVKISNGKGCPEFAPESYELIPSKPKYLFINGGMKMVGNSGGFPDFIALRTKYILNGVNGYNPDTGEKYNIEESHRAHIKEVIGVESKMTGELDLEEKKKCKWLLDNKVFSKILIAEKTKVKNRVVIVYHDFKTKYYRFYE